MINNIVRFRIHLFMLDFTFFTDFSIWFSWISRSQPHSKYLFRPPKQIRSASEFWIANKYLGQIYGYALWLCINTYLEQKQSDKSEKCGKLQLKMLEWYLRSIECFSCYSLLFFSFSLHACIILFPLISKAISEIISFINSFQSDFSISVFTSGTANQPTNKQFNSISR